MNSWTRFFFRASGFTIALLTAGNFCLAENDSVNPSSQSSDLPPLPLATPPHFMRMSNERLGEKDNSNYLNEILEHTQKRVFRFKSMPIPVYITPIDDPSFSGACIGGFEAWEKASDGLVRFVQVNDPDQARIRVVWKHLGTGQGAGEGALGAHTTTSWKSEGKNLLHVAGVPLPVPTGKKFDVPPQTIEVNLDVIYSRDDEMRPVLLRNIVTHELGHALGLIGHSSNRSDIMNAGTDEFSRLSQRDLNTLIELYKLKPDVAL